MSFTHEGKKLYNNEWTNAIIDKKDFWENYAASKEFEIDGSFSNFHVKFDIPIELKGIRVNIYGHRNFVNVHNNFNNPDIYNEVFEIKMHSEKKLPIPKSYSIKNNFIGWIKFQISSLNKKRINDNYNLTFKDEIEFRLLKSMGVFNFRYIDKIKTDPKMILIRLSRLPEKPNEINAIEKLIQNIKTVHNTSSYEKQ